MADSRIIRKAVKLQGSWKRQGGMMSINGRVRAVVVRIVGIQRSVRRKGEEKKMMESIWRKYEPDRKGWIVKMT